KMQDRGSIIWRDTRCRVPNFGCDGTRVACNSSEVVQPTRLPPQGIRDGGRYEKRTSFPGSISKSSTSDSDVFGLIISASNFTKIESSRKMAYLSIDSKSSAIKKGQAMFELMRLPHLMLNTSGILSSCMREFIIISSTRAGVTSGLSL